MKHGKSRSTHQLQSLSAAVSEDHQPEYRDTASFTATEAKNEFGRLLERAIQGETVVITKHDAPKAVLISMDKFNALKRAPEFKLAALGCEFDALLARMQGRQASLAMKTAFSASPQQLGKAAVLATRKRA